MGNMLLVDNLTAQVTDDDLVARFGDYGIVRSATIGFAGSATAAMRSACVVMASCEEAQAAIDWLHETRFKGSTISVARAGSIGPLH